MENKKVCGKCKSLNLWKPKGPPYDDFDKMNIGWNDVLSLIKITCLDCGFVELYVDLNELNEKRMKKIEEKWIQVNRD